MSLQERRVHPDCRNTSNPFHECSDYCFRIIAEIKAQMDQNQSGSANAVKSGGKPPREPAPARNAAYNSGVSMPPSRLLSSVNGEHYSSSEAYSGGIQVEDPSFNEKQVHSSHLPDSSKQAVKSLPSEPPVYQKRDENHHVLPEAGSNPVVSKNREGTTGSPSGSMSFSFSGITRSAEASDDDESQSVISDASVSVGKYRVKGRLSPILLSIFDKYGDIAASCHLESIAMRSYSLECVCFVVQELQLTQVMNLTKSKAKEMLAILKDLESLGIDVAWLRRVLCENSETIELINQHQAIEEARTNCVQDIESAKKKLESQMEGLNLKEKELDDAKKLIAETQAHLIELELKCLVLSETISSIKSKVETLNGKSLLDGVL